MYLEETNIRDLYVKGIISQESEFNLRLVSMDKRSLTQTKKFTLSQIYFDRAIAKLKTYLKDDLLQIELHNSQIMKDRNKNDIGIVKLMDLPLLVGQRVFLAIPFFDSVLKLVFQFKIDLLPMEETASQMYFLYIYVYYRGGGVIIIEDSARVTEAGEEKKDISIGKKPPRHKIIDSYANLDEAIIDIQMKINKQKEENKRLSTSSQRAQVFNTNDYVYI